MLLQETRLGLQFLEDFVTCDDAGGSALAALDDGQLLLRGGERGGEAGDDVLRDSPECGFGGEHQEPGFD
ncbi:MAG: hypothetical protein LBG05_06075 [Treponema sp.]|nr:hypothetical protein [Treponema sp.]